MQKNQSLHHGIKCSPFKATYGVEPEVKLLNAVVPSLLKPLFTQQTSLNSLTQSLESDDKDEETFQSFESESDSEQIFKNLERDMNEFENGIEINNQSDCIIENHDENSSSEEVPLETTNICRRS